MKIFGKLLISFSFIFLFCQASRGQEDEFLKGRLFLSPDFGLLVGTITSIEVAPAVGYYLTDRLCIAGGFIYKYYKQSGNYFDNFETNIYGPKAFARYTLIRNLGDILPVQSNLEILTHIEFESLNMEKIFIAEEGRYWYSTALIGGGISQSSSERIKINALILWDVDTSSRSPYSNPIFRLGIQFMFR